MTIRDRSLHEHLEVANHAEAIELLYSIALQARKIKEADVLRMHAVILDKIRSEWAVFIATIKFTSAARNTVLLAGRQCRNL